MMWYLPLLMFLCVPALCSGDSPLDTRVLVTPNTKHEIQYKRVLEKPQQGDTAQQADWPCPLAEEISPCTCGHDGARLSIICDNVVDIEEIERIFSVEFPFNNLWEIALIVNDVDVWMNSEAADVPKNVFKDKTAKHIWIDLKVEQVDPLAFENTAHELEDLSISGPGWADAKNPIEVFPFYILDDFPNLRWFMLQGTMLSDRTFEWHESRPLFSDLILPNLGG